MTDKRPIFEVEANDLILSRASISEPDLVLCAGLLPPMIIPSGPGFTRFFGDFTHIEIDVTKSSNDPSDILYSWFDVMYIYHSSVIFRAHILKGFADAMLSSGVIRLALFCVQNGLPADSILCRQIEVKEHSNADQ